MEVGICIFPGPPGSSKCPSDLQLIERPTENLLFATLIPFDCYRIPCLFQLNFFSFLPFFRHIFFSSLFPSFLFFTLSKRTQNSFAVTRQTLDVLFTLIFISTVIDTSLFTLIYLYLFAISYWYWCSFYTIIWIVYEIVIEAVVRRCYVKKVFLEILQNSQLFFNQVVRLRPGTDVFLSILWNFKETFFHRTPLVAAFAAEIWGI